MQDAPVQSERLADLGYEAIVDVMAVSRFSPGAWLLVGLLKYFRSSDMEPVLATSSKAVVAIDEVMMTSAFVALTLTSALKPATAQLPILA